MSTQSSGAYQVRREDAPTPVTPHSGAASPSLAETIIQKVYQSPLARVAALGGMLLGTSEATLAQSVTNKPPAVGDLVTVVESGVTNSYQVAVKSAGTNSLQICLVPPARNGPVLQGPPPTSEYANVLPIGTIITNVVDGVTNRYRVTTDPQANLAPVAMADTRVFPFGFSDTATGNEVANLPGAYNRVIGWQAVYKLRNQNGGRSTRPNKVPDGIKYWLPQACPTGEFLNSGSQMDGDPAVARVVYPVNVDSPGVEFSQRPDQLFNLKIDFTNPNVINGAKVYRPGTPDHFIVQGGRMVFSDTVDGDINSFGAHLAGSQTEASPSATGYERNVPFEAIGPTANDPVYASDPLPTVAIGIITQGLELLPPNEQERQDVKLTIERNPADGSLTLKFSEPLKYPAYVTAAYELGVGGSGTAFYPIAPVEAGTQSFVLDRGYLKAANKTSLSDYPGSYYGMSMFYGLAPREPDGASALKTGK